MDALSAAAALALESVLEQSGWTDVLEVDVGGAPVYVDETGVSNDLVPALDVVREDLLAQRTPSA